MTLSKMELANGKLTDQPRPRHEKSPGSRPIGRSKPFQHHNDNPCNEQKQSKKDKYAAKIGHEISLRAGKHLSGVTKKLGGLAGLRKDAHGPGQFAGLLTHTQKIGIKTGQDNDPACRQLARNIQYQPEAIPVRHSNVAQHQMGKKLARARKSLIGRVSSTHIKTALSEDKRKRIGDQTIIIYDQHSMRVFVGLLHSFAVAVQPAVLT